MSAFMVKVDASTHRAWSSRGAGSMQLPKSEASKSQGMTRTALKLMLTNVDKWPSAGIRERRFRRSPLPV